MCYMISAINYGGNYYECKSNSKKNRGVEGSNK